jgi:hypothetical protein
MRSFIFGTRRQQKTGRRDALSIFFAPLPFLLSQDMLTGRRDALSIFFAPLPFLLSQDMLTCSKE